MPLCICVCTWMAFAACTSPGPPGLDCTSPDIATPRLFLYGGGGLAGSYPANYTGAEIEFAAATYEVVPWLYGGSGVSEALRGSNPEVTTLLYYDAIFAGYYLTGLGMDWMPEADWLWVDAHEDMFAHDAGGARIQNNIWTDEYLMDVADFDPDDPTSRDHWRSFLAERVAEIVRDEGDFAGVFLDELMIPLPPLYPERIPAGFDPAAWYEDLEETVALVRGAMGEGRVVYWNGLIQDIFFHPEITGLLDITDGVLVECLATCDVGLELGIIPVGIALEVVDLVPRYPDTIFLLQSTRDGATLEDRLYALGLYLLAAGPNTRHFFNDLSIENDGLQFYPEWRVPIGLPVETGETGDYYLDEVDPGAVYRRVYECGEVVVNLSIDEDAVLLLDETRHLLRAEGGGLVADDGTTSGTLWTEPVDEVTLPPSSGAVLLREAR